MTESAVIHKINIMERLKYETSLHSESIEDILDLLRPNLSLAEYRQILSRLYGFYAPWERRIRAVLDHNSISFYQGRIKQPALANDLHQLGLEAKAISQLPECTNLPPLVKLPQILGSLYVIENTTLGGQSIAKHLKRTLGLNDGGCDFFSAYGSDTGPQWKAFGKLLLELTTPDTEEVIIASACDTFLALRSWLLREEAAAA